MNLKPREKWLAGVAVLVGMVMGFDQFVTLPKKKEVIVLQKQVEESNEKLGSVTVSLSGLKAIRKRVEEKRRAKALVAGKVADDHQVGLLLDQIGKEGQKQQVQLTQLTINEGTSGQSAGKKEGTKEQAYKKVVMEVGLVAGYGSIGSYLESLQALPIFMEFERIDITRKEDSFPKLEVTISQGLYISKTGTKKEGGKANGRESPSPS